MISTGKFLVLLSCAASSCGVEAFSIDPQPRPSVLIDEATPASRRTFLDRVLVSGAAAAAAASLGSPPASGAMEPEDYSGDFIQKLKERSDAKRSEYDAKAASGSTGWKKLDTAKFSAQYQRPTYLGVRRKDMTYKMLSPEEVEELQKAGVIIAEYDTILNSLGQEVLDYKKGLVLQFATVKEGI